jgi:hypothetical protein
MTASHDTQLKTLVIDDIQAPAVLTLIWAETGSPALRELLLHSRQAFGLEYSEGIPPIRAGAERR